MYFEGIGEWGKQITGNAGESGDQTRSYNTRERLETFS